MHKPIIRLRVDSTHGMAGVYIADQIISSGISSQRKVNRSVGIISRHNQLCRSVSVIVDRDEIDLLVDDGGGHIVHRRHC